MNQASQAAQAIKDANKYIIALKLNAAFPPIDLIYSARVKFQEALRHAKSMEDSPEKRSAILALMQPLDKLFTVKFLSLIEDDEDAALSAFVEIVDTEYYPNYWPNLESAMYGLITVAISNDGKPVETLQTSATMEPEEEDSTTAPRAAVTIHVRPLESLEPLEENIVVALFRKGAKGKESAKPIGTINTFFRTNDWDSQTETQRRRALQKLSKDKIVETFGRKYYLSGVGWDYGTSLTGKARR